MSSLLWTSMAAISTAIGGCFAILFRRQLPMLMAVGAGTLIGAALFDLLPGAQSAAAIGNYPQRFLIEFAGLGALLSHCMHSEGRGELTGRCERITQNNHGKLGATLLILHSVVDGGAIFAASKISVQLGILVGLGVVAHDLCDGLNTLLLSSGCAELKWSDYVVLAGDALAPLTGGLVAAHVFFLPPTALMMLLSFAAGSFLYTALFALLPDAYFRFPSVRLGFCASGGFLFILGLTAILKHLS